MKRFSAYIGKALRDGMGCDGIVGQSYQVTDFGGKVLCHATLGSRWYAPSAYSLYMGQYYCIKDGREYTGRSRGECMLINFRETAESVRKNAAKG